MGNKRKWSDLSKPQRIAAVILGSIQVSLALAAWIDLARRPPSLVRGRKRMWAMVLPINIIGPLSYFKWGRLDAPTLLLASEVDDEVAVAD
jgi:hypothetical protein